MKKFVGSILTIALIFQSFGICVFAYTEQEAIKATQHGNYEFLPKTVETFYSQDFEDVCDVADAASLDKISPGMSISVCDAGKEGVGKNGNNMLCLEMDAATERDIREISLINPDGRVVPTGKRLQFQLDFYKTSPLSNMKFFVTRDLSGRSKDNGLVQLTRDGSPVYGDRFRDGNSNLIYGSDSGKTKEEMGEIAPGQWYRLTITWTPNGTSPENPLEKVVLTRLSDESEIFELTDVAVKNSTWPLANISYLGLGVATYSNFPYQKIYYDNISLKEIVEIDEITSILPASEYEEFFKNSYEPAFIARSLEPLCDDAYSHIMMHKLKNYADGTLLTGDIVTSADFSDDNLAYAREVQDISFILGYLYKVTGKNEYADFLDRQLAEFAADMILWPDYPFLYPAEGITALSAGYVWAGDGLSGETKEVILRSVKKRLDLALTFYEPKYKYIAVDWGNQAAVGNGGLIVTSIAFGNEFPELCSKILHHSLRAMRASIAVLYPDGATMEGPGYWQYQMRYTVYALSTLDAVFESDFGLSNAGPLDKTGLYHIDMHSSDPRAFNFSDSGASTPQIMMFYYLAKKFNQPYLAAYADFVCPNGVNYGSWESKHGDIMAMLWRTGTHDGYEDLPLYALYGGKQAVSVERSGFYPGATYFAIKGGYAQNPHGSMDVGTFVLDSMGERWADDLGGEDYDGSGYWDFTDTGRWTYYSQRAEGHNTLVINPDEGADQNDKAIALFENRNTLNMEEMYDDCSVIRSFEMTDAGHRVVLKDVIEPRKISDIYWFMHTGKSVEILGNTAVLSEGGKRCIAKILSPQNAVFTLEDAKPLIIENNKDAITFDNYKKLQIHLNTSEKTEIKVEFSFENDEFLIENTKDNIVRFNSKVDFEKSNAHATDIHGNKVGVSIFKIDDYTLKYAPDFEHPDNVYFISFEGVMDINGIPLSGEKVVVWYDDNNFDSDLYFNGFDEDFVLEEKPYELIATRKIDGKSCLMIYDDTSIENADTSFYTTPLTDGGKNRIVFECDTMLTYNGNEKKLFRLHDSNGTQKCDALVTLAPMAVNNDYKHAWARLPGGSYVLDELTGEPYKLEINRMYKIKAVVDFAVYPAKLCLVSVTDLESGEAAYESVESAVYLSGPFYASVGQKVWKTDKTYFDNLSIYCERKDFEIISLESNDEMVNLMIANYESERKINVFIAVYGENNSLRNVKFEKFDAVIGINKFETENIAGESRRVFVWSEEGKPYV